MEDLQIEYSTILPKYPEKVHKMN